MGLDTTHDCWHGAYSAFHRWRCELARAAGLPPLDFMEGFWSSERRDNHRNPFYWARQGLSSENSFQDIEDCLPIRWDCLKPSPLHILLHHSDCDGRIEAADCGPIADALEALLPKMPEGEGGGHIGNWRDKTSQFIEGLRAASAAGEDVEFH